MVELVFVMGISHHTFFIIHHSCRMPSNPPRAGIGTKWFSTILSGTNRTAEADKFFIKNLIINKITHPELIIQVKHIRHYGFNNFVRTRLYFSKEMSERRCFLWRIAFSTITLRGYKHSVNGHTISINEKHLPVEFIDLIQFSSHNNLYALNG